MIKGSCLCGAIEYSVELIAGKVFNCHCSQCRKSHGAAFASQAFAYGETLRLLKGEEFLSEYAGHGGIRAFCSQCGSRLMNYAPNKRLYLSIALSSVDCDDAVDACAGKPIAHAFVGSKAAWHTPARDIPAFPAMPEGAHE